MSGGHGRNFWCQDLLSREFVILSVKLMTKMMVVA